MNYRVIYERLIEYRKNNKPEGYVEKHHIIPKSLGGNNSKENLVELTAREHFIAHRLLCKIHIGKDKAKMAYALKMMINRNHQHQRVFPSRYYKIAREEVNKSCSGENHHSYGKAIWSEKQKALISERQAGINNSNYGKDPWNKGLKGFKHSEETKEKMSLAHLYKKKTDEHRKNLSISHTGKKLSEETKEKLRQINLGKKKSKESIEKTASKLRGRTHEIVTCPYCKKEGGHSSMKRWHFENCKEK